MLESSGVYMVERKGASWRFGQKCCHQSRNLRKGNRHEKPIGDSVRNLDVCGLAISLSRSRPLDGNRGSASRWLGPTSLPSMLPAPSATVRGYFWNPGYWAWNDVGGYTGCRDMGYCAGRHVVGRPDIGIRGGLYAAPRATGGRTSALRWLVNMVRNGGVGFWSAGNGAAALCLQTVQLIT